MNHELYRNTLDSVYQYNLGYLQSRVLCDFDACDYDHVMTQINSYAESRRTAFIHLFELWVELRQPHILELEGLCHEFLSLPEDDTLSYLREKHCQPVNRPKLNQQ